MTINRIYFETAEICIYLSLMKFPNVVLVMAGQCKEEVEQKLKWDWSCRNILEGLLWSVTVLFIRRPDFWSFGAAEGATPCCTRWPMKKGYSTTTNKLLPSIRTKLPTESSLNERKASISCNRRNICFHTLPALSSTEPITEDRPLKLPPKTPVSGIEPITGLGHLPIRG